MISGLPDHALIDCGVVRRIARPVPIRDERHKHGTALPPRPVHFPWNVIARSAVVKIDHVGGRRGGGLLQRVGIIAVDGEGCRRWRRHQELQEQHGWREKFHSVGDVVREFERTSDGTKTRFLVIIETKARKQRRSGCDDRFSNEGSRDVVSSE